MRIKIWTSTQGLVVWVAANGNDEVALAEMTWDHSKAKLDKSARIQKTPGRLGKKTVPYWTNEAPASANRAQFISDLFVACAEFDIRFKIQGDDERQLLVTWLHEHNIIFPEKH